jgi:hypothetical protein
LATNDDYPLQALTLADLVRLSGLALEEVHLLVELGAFEPLAGQSGEHRQFAAHCALRARSAGRLRRELGLDALGIAVAISYQERIESLEGEIRRLRCLLPES